MSRAKLADGRTSYSLVPRINAEVLRRCRGPSPRHSIFAGAGTSSWSRIEPDGTWRDRKSPEGLTQVFLLPYSPELQPAERLWKLCDEPLANRTFPSLDELEAILGERCRVLAEHPEWIRDHCLYHSWLPNE
jgi:transposase